MREIGKVNSDGIDFGKTAQDYAKHRAGFPTLIFDLLKERSIGITGQSLVDLGTGTGTLARGFAARGVEVTGIDPSEAILEQARLMAQDEGIRVTFQRGSSEATGLASGNFDVVTAGQCWHWFEAAKTTKECLWLLKPGGYLVICHFDWLPLPGNVVSATENLISKHNPAWEMSGGTGIYPQWTIDMATGGFEAIETFSQDLLVRYSHEDWRGRIRASAGVSASLSPEDVVAFDKEHADLLHREFSADPLFIPHRLWCAVARKPKK
ncbi:methyltransferase [Kiloniella spongiae]|uniref:Methyltransferase n=1 Tax=Kiloniella spongiae TaxID=1489064 RepID=A0A0H2MC56_9PROT|nr:class I SAM-dependent methyltransferase [Kiloniella spongiae]KLN59903.1 methyltransferase [Kiloniella spongiae]